MKPELLIGKIACAYVLPDQVQRGVARPGAEKIVGAVTASKDLPDSQPGGVPNKLLTIRGQSGRTMDVDLLRNWVQLFDTWDEANAEKAKP
jgi:hypothetical protein